jgi:hypothetical protein
MEDALRRYQLTEEEFLSWQRAFETHGLAGLRATRVQQYRTPRPPRGPRSRRWSHWFSAGQVKPWITTAAPGSPLGAASLASLSLDMDIDFDLAFQFVRESQIVGSRM